jgi:chaperone BCS1
MLITWVSSQPFARKAYSTIASVGSRRRGFTDGHLDGNQKKALQYSPWNGSFSFWYKNHMLTFQSVEKESRYFREEQVSVSCIGRNPDILRAFLSECRTEYLKLIKNKTSIFQHHNGDWKKIRTVDVRRLDTVILSDEKKTAMLDDVKSFLQSRTWYSERGIPYRRGYLLYGPPGTGKSSLSLSIAGECDLDIYILNLSSVDDDSLGELFIELPPRCVILLEDIDAVKAAHSRQRRTASTGQGATKSPTKGEPGGKVSLSALLNVVDGVGSQEGRLLIMTTNHIERLDAALIRPGRVDKKVKFDLTNQDIVAQLFYAIFRRGASDNVERAEDDAELKKLAADFASKVPEHEFSPADIQLFLLEYKESPRRAVENVQEWIIRAREENRHMTAAESEGSCGSIPASTPDILTTLDGIQAEKIASARPTTRTPQTTVFTHCGSCQLLQDVGRVLEAHQITELDHMTLGHLKLLTDFVRAEYIDTKLATPPSSPNLSSVTACEGRLLSTQPILKDSEHNPNLTELWPLGLAEESSRVKGPVAAVSSQPELRPGGGNATRPRFLNELTAEKISAYTDDVCSETTSDEASNGTSFEGESEPGNIMATISLDGSTISPLATLQEKEIAATMGDAVKSENPPTRSVELGYKTINEVFVSHAKSEMDRANIVRVAGTRRRAPIKSWNQIPRRSMQTNSTNTYL